MTNSIQMWAARSRACRTPWFTGACFPRASNSYRQLLILWRRPVHDLANGPTIFDRLDWQPNGTDAFHNNLLAAGDYTCISVYLHMCIPLNV